MVTNKLFAPVVLLAALSLTALPAAAGQGRSRESHGDRGKAVAHATQRQAAPRQSARQNELRQGQASRSETRRQQGPSRQAAPQQSARRQGESRQQAARVEPRREQGPSRPAPRANERGGAALQADAPGPNRAPRSALRPNEAPRSAPRAQPGRTYAVPRGTYGRRDERPANRDGRRYDRDGRAYRPSYGSFYRPSYRPYYRPRYFARPYFAFRPRLSIGFGLWLGYPVAYPYAYVGGYAPGLYGSVGVVRGVSIYGGLSFDVSPYDAAIFVDGQYVGTVADFPPNAPPLTLTPGVYRIEVQASGYRPMVWDVTIVPGQVIPYRGAMQPY